MLISLHEKIIISNIFTPFVC